MSSSSGIVGLVVALIGTVDECHQASGVGKRQRPEQRGVEEREDRGVGANTEREHDDGESRQERLTPEHPCRMPKVAHEIVRPAGDACFAHPFAREDDIAEGSAVPRSPPPHDSFPVARSPPSGCRGENGSRRRSPVRVPLAPPISKPAPEGHVRRASAPGSRRWPDASSVLLLRPGASGPLTVIA